MEKITKATETTKAATKTATKAANIPSILLLTGDREKSLLGALSARFGGIRISELPLSAASLNSKDAEELLRSLRDDGLSPIVVFDQEGPGPLAADLQGPENLESLESRESLESMVSSLSGLAPVVLLTGEEDGRLLCNEALSGDVQLLHKKHSESLLLNLLADMMARTTQNTPLDR